jgi:hypothetical protein
MVKLMAFRPTTLERAFDLARSGECAHVDDILKRLNAEGFGTQQVSGPSLIRQLRELCAHNFTVACARS